MPRRPHLLRKMSRLPMFRPYFQQQLIELFGRPRYGKARRGAVLNPLLTVPFLFFSALNLIATTIYLLLVSRRLRHEPAVRPDLPSPTHCPSWPTGDLLRLVDKHGFDRLYRHEPPSPEVGIESGITSRYIFGSTQFTVGTELDPRLTPALHGNHQWRYKIIADANYLPIRTGVFRSIAMVHVLNNCERIQGILDECVRVLSPGGILVFSTFGPAMLDAGPFGAFASSWLPARLRIRLNSRLFSRHRQFQFDPKTIRAALAKSGLIIDGEVGYWDREASRIWATLHYAFYRRHGLFYLYGLRRLGITGPLFRFQRAVTWVLERQRFHQAVASDEAGEVIYRARRPSWSTR